MASIARRAQLRRYLVLTLVVVSGGLSMARAAQQPAAGRGGGGLNAAPSAEAIQIETLAPNLFVLRAGGGNTAAFVTAAGVVLVDTKVSGWGQHVLTRLRELTDKPVTTIINTHAHFDHVNGNPELPRVEVVTHQNTKTYMEQWNPIWGFFGETPNPFPAAGGRNMPTHTFTDRLAIGSGADQIDLYYYGRAHTGGDAYVVFRAARVMHAGDTFPSKGLPIMDRNNGGSGVEYPATLTRAAATAGVERVITGHSTTMTAADLKEYAGFIGEFVTAVQEAKRAGRTLDDFVATWKVPAHYTGFAQPQRASLQAVSQVIWDETR